MAKVKRLNDELAEVQPLRRVNWFGRLPKEVQAELLEVRADYHAGRFKGLSVRQIFDYLSNEKRGSRRVTTGRNGFQVWLAEGRRGETK